MNNYSKAEKSDTQSEDEQKLVRLLKEMPDIFQRHPELITTLELSHNSGRATSIIERQVSLLREKLKTSDHRLRDLMNIARENEKLSQSLLRLAINLLGARELDDTISIVLNELKNELKAEYAVIKLLTDDQHRIEQQPDRFVSKKDKVLNEFSTMLQHKNPLCGRCSDAQKAFLFSDDAGQVKSAAVLPLVAGADLGFIGLGSQNEEKFVVSMGTDFLRQVAELVSASLAVHLE